MEVSRPLSERKARPQKDQSLNCPRCSSTNTKFCYYNNYSLNQPRYFCKTCRRYWTEGGSLRNVPVGGGSRKNERSTSSSSKKLTDHPTQHGFPQSATQNPKIHELQDLNLAYPPLEEDLSYISKFVEVPPYSTGSRSHHQNSCSSSISSQPMSSMELLKTGMTSRGLNSFIPIPTIEPNRIFSNGPVFQEFRPTNLNFSLEGSEGRHRTIQGESETGAKLLFPTEDLKQNSTNIEFQQNQGEGDHSIGYWNGMMGRGSW